MATSDSEDFESADEEWEERTDISNKLGEHSKKSSVEVKTHTSVESKILTSDDTEVEVDSIAKCVEQNVCIQEKKLATNAPHTDESSEVHDIDKNIKQAETHTKKDCSTILMPDSKKSLSVESEVDKKTKQSGPHGLCLKQGSVEPVSELSEEYNITKQPETQIKGNHALPVKQGSEKVLGTSEGDKNTKQSQTQAKENHGSAKNESEKQLSDIRSDSIEPKSKEAKPNSNLEIETSVSDFCSGETDGWECEDEDLNDLIEESSSRSNMDNVLNKLSESVEKQEKQNSDGGWGSWGSWGVTSLLSTATESVSTLTNQVSQGLSTVLETGLGVPDPEELAKQEIEEEKKLLASVKENSELKEEEKKEDEESGRLFGFGRVISGVTKLVETAGTKVVSGGLDTLETIGKKTMEVLQDGDPGLRKKRAIFSDKVVLSQVLREAKDKAELEDKALRSTEEARKVHFETLFDDYHGLVHLEALEMLSKQCNIKLQSVLLNTPHSDVAELQEVISEIKESCQLPDEEDAEGASFETLEVKVAEAGKGLGVPVANEKLLKTWQEIHHWLQECRNKQNYSSEEKIENADNPSPTAREIHQKAIGTLARLTAEAVEQFHKTAELLLVYEKRNPSEEAKILLDMTSIFSLQVSTAATVFSENLNTCSEYAENRDVVNSHITNVFLEAANSSSYIQEAFQLLIPVLQVGAVSS